MDRTLTISKHETVVDKYDLEYLQECETSIPAYRYEDTEGWYVYDEVHGRHLLIHNALHGLSEKRIVDTDKLYKTNDGIEWIKIKIPNRS